MEKIEEQKIESESSKDLLLIDKVTEFYSNLHKDELEVAYYVMNIISNHLHKKHFKNKIHINTRALVRTFDELDKIGSDTYKKLK